MRTALFSVFGYLVLLAGCVYDYSSLRVRQDAGTGGGVDRLAVIGTGGHSETGGTSAAASSGGAGPAGGGGSTPAYDADAGQGGTLGGSSSGGTPASGGTSSGGTAGLAGASTGGVSGGSGSAGASGGPGGQGSGGAGGLPAGPRILSIDFIGGDALAVTGGSAPGTGGRGGAGNPGTGGMVLMSLPAMTAEEVAGFKPASHWNGAFNLNGSLPGLSLADGTVTTATVIWNSPPASTGRGIWRVGYTDAPGNVRMMNGYLDPHDGTTFDLPATVTVSGLPAAITTGGYDVYVYMSGEVPSATTRTYRYSIGATSFSVTETGPTPTTFAAFKLAPAGGAGNYVVFRNQTAASFTLNATPANALSGRAPLNGIQIVSPSGF